MLNCIADCLFLHFMPKRPVTPAEKTNLHPRNRHRDRYDFPALIVTCPDLEQYVSVNQHQELSIDFTEAAAVKALNRALLNHFYGIKLWDIPAGYLCPPIPGRADYIHYAADLLANDNSGVIPVGKKVRVLDIGVGANCIYPLIGNREYGWRFVGSEIDTGAIKAARSIVLANGLEDQIVIRKQPAKQFFFREVVKAGEKFDLTVCNPPFYASAREAEETTARKWKKLHRTSPGRNFGGQHSELWCAGGEAAFIRRMIEESADFAQSCTWFTTLVSSKETLSICDRTLEKVGASEVKVIGMSQGQKVSRILAWRYHQPIQPEAGKDQAGAGIYSTIK